MLPAGVTGAPDAVALAWLPLVGIVLGTIAGGLAWAIGRIAPEPFVVAAAFSANIILSGAVHVDGFLDACDALVASVPPQRRLEIMKDPRHGTFAVAGFAAVAVWWIAALLGVPAATLPWALAFSGGASRLAAVLNAYRLPYGRAGASATVFATRPPWPLLCVAAIVLVAIALGAHAPWWILVGVVAAGFALVLGEAAARRLGGVLVGDVYGATIVVLDVAVLTAIAGLQGH